MLVIYDLEKIFLRGDEKQVRNASMDTISNNQKNIFDPQNTSPVFESVLQGVARSFSHAKLLHNSNFVRAVSSGKIKENPADRGYFFVF